MSKWRFLTNIVQGPGLKILSQALHRSIRALLLSMAGRKLEHQWRLGGPLRTVHMRALDSNVPVCTNVFRDLVDTYRSLC